MCTESVSLSTSRLRSLSAMRCMAGDCAVQSVNSALRRIPNGFTDRDTIERLTKDLLIDGKHHSIEDFRSDSKTLFI